MTRKHKQFWGVALPFLLISLILHALSVLQDTTKEELTKLWNALVELHYLTQSSASILAALELDTILLTLSIKSNGSKPWHRQ